MFQFDLLHLGTSITSALIAFAFYWGTTRSEITSLETRAAASEKDARELKEAYGKLHREFVTHKFFEQAIHSLQQTHSRMETELQVVQTDIKQILRILGGHADDSRD